MFQKTKKLLETFQEMARNSGNVSGNGWKLWQHFRKRLETLVMFQETTRNDLETFLIFGYGLETF